MADRHRHLRLPALVVGIDSVRGEVAPVPHADDGPDGIDGIGERIGGAHVLGASAEPPAHRPHGTSLPVVHADRAEGSAGRAAGGICHLSRQGADGIPLLVGIDAYHRHDVCQVIVGHEGVVVVVVDDFKLRVADGVGSRVARLADTAVAACVRCHGEDGVTLAVPVAACPLHAEPAEASPGSIFSMTRPLWS